MMNKAQATQAIKNGATLAIHTETRKAYLYIGNECHTVRIDTAERIACEMAVDLRYYLTWGEDGDRVEEYEVELSLEQEEAVERGLTREQALQGGGAFGLVACIDSVAFDVETLGKDARELLAQFEERAQRDPFFNRSMITACRAYIEAHPTQAQEEEQPTAQAEELTAFVVSFVKNDVPQARVIKATDAETASAYFQTIEPSADVCGVSTDNVGMEKRGCPVEVVPTGWLEYSFEVGDSVTGYDPYTGGQHVYTVAERDGDRVTFDVMRHELDGDHKARESYDIERDSLGELVHLSELEALRPLSKMDEARNAYRREQEARELDRNARKVREALEEAETLDELADVLALVRASKLRGDFFFSIMGELNSKRDELEQEASADELEQMTDTLDGIETREDLQAFELEAIHTEKLNESDRAELLEAIEEKREDIDRAELPHDFAKALRELSDVFKDGGDFSTRYHFFDDLGAYAWEFFVDYCNDSDSAPMDWAGLEEMTACMSGADAFRLGVFVSSDFNYNDDIFSFNGYGNLQSFASWYGFFDREVDFDRFAEFMAEEHEEEARELLEEYADELSK